MNGLKRCPKKLNTENQTLKIKYENLYNQYIFLHTEYMYLDLYSTRLYMI